ncbi:MAG: ATP-binding cassette domain-containing protein [Bacteroidales bacterium]|jgi:ABC-type lipoprotein export system ATPase subunit|nr:ATP-binding cassette domain-containing protein [Bacteroidales bacterium]
MIKLSGITKSYPDGEDRVNHVLRGVELNVGKGDFVAIKGASGSGKTTLLSILGTLLLPDSGSYLLDGKEMLTPGVDHSLVRNKSIGFVFQEHRLMPQYSAWENILLPVLAYQQKVNPEQEQHAQQLMEITGISGIAKQYPSTLSGGEASRVAVCRALIMKPLLVLADEPTGQLDSANARNIALLLSEINKTLHTTIVMVTHSDEVSSMAKRILILQNGILHFTCY